MPAERGRPSLRCVGGVRRRAPHQVRQLVDRHALQRGASASSTAAAAENTWSGDATDQTFGMP
jgi:hypothetical protein